MAYGVDRYGRPVDLEGNQTSPYLDTAKKKIQPTQTTPPTQAQNPASQPTQPPTQPPAQPLAGSVPLVSATGVPTPAPMYNLNLPSFAGSPAPSYTAGTLPTTALPTYSASPITQFQAPNQAPTQDATSALIQRLLSTTSMSDANVAQLNERQKEAALALQEQQRGILASDAARRGVFGGGTSAGSSRELLANTINSVLSGQRETALQKMTQDRADQLAAAQAAESAMTGQVGRATSAFGAGLAGEQARAGENQVAFASEADRVKFALDQALAQEEANQAAAASGQSANAQMIQAALGQGNAALSQAQLNEQARQFNANLGYLYSKLPADYLSQLFGG